MRPAVLFDRIANRVLYFGYVNAQRLRQWPAIVADHEPQFLEDETVTAAVGDVYAIAVKFALFGLDDGFLDLLEALKRQQINTVVVLNGRPSESDLVKIRQRAHRVLVRRNVGRDFGAYRAASLKLAGEGIKPARLLYFNDSLIYLPGLQLDQLVAAFRDSKYDAVGAFENHTGLHHLGAFAFSLSGRAATDPRIVAFWRDYRSYDIRPHAIFRGEILLSQRVKECGYALDAVYSSNRLAAALDTLSVESLLGLLRFLPSYGRTDIRQSLAKAPAEAARAFRGLNDPVVGARGNPSSGGTAIAARTRGFATGDRVTRDLLIDQILSQVIHSSQIHGGFGLFYRLFRSPLVKKDLLAHSVFLEHECARILDDLPQRDLDRILRELINRGRPVHPLFMRRFKLRNGLI